MSFAERAKGLGHGFAIELPDRVDEAADGASILTLATRAREPFLTPAMVAPGAHINAIGAITPEREEFTAELLDRATLVAADDPLAARKLSREFQRFFGDEDRRWAMVRPVSELVDHARPRGDADLSVFKAMGMGVSDLALGIELLARARARKLGRTFDHPRRATARLGRHSGEQQ